MLALANYGPALTGLVVSRMHASAPDGVVVHIHDPVGWWGGHAQPFTLDHVLAVAEPLGRRRAGTAADRLGAGGDEPARRAGGARACRSCARRSGAGRSATAPTTWPARRSPPSRPACGRDGDLPNRRTSVYALRHALACDRRPSRPRAGGRSAAGPWLHVGPTAFPPITAVAAQGNSLFALAQNGDIWRADAGSGLGAALAPPGQRHQHPGRVAGCGLRGLDRPEHPLALDGRRAHLQPLRPRGPAARHGVRRSRRPTSASASSAPTASRSSSNGCRTWKRPKITGRIRSIARNGTTWLAIVERPNLARADRFRPARLDRSRRAPGACARTARRCSSGRRPASASRRWWPTG